MAPILGPLIIFFFGASQLPATLPERPTLAQLADVSTRGRRLADYDRAAWHGTDAVFAINPDKRLVTDYIAKVEPSGKWRVVFGARSQTDDSFLINYEAVQGSNPSEFAASRKQPPITDTDWFLRASRAIDVVRASFPPPTQRPYNRAVLEAPSGEWFVYVYPASTNAGVWPLGGDTRYLVSRDGRTIVSTRQLHRGVIETSSLPDSADSKVTAGFHSHVLACIPEDTDVLAVLSRQPRVQEFITCYPFTYVVETDGSIELLGLTKDILDNKAKK